MNKNIREIFGHNQNIPMNSDRIIIIREYSAIFKIGTIIFFFILQNIQIQRKD